MKLWQVADPMEQVRNVKKIRGVARDYRSALGISDQAAPDMLDVLNRLSKTFPNLRVEIVQDSDAPNAEAWVSSRGLVVKESVVKSLAYGDPRARWTLAHEIGHLALGHRGRLFRASGPARRIPQREEREASIFASEFLAPTQLAEGKSVEEIRRLFQISHAAASIRIAELKSTDKVPRAPAARARVDVVNELSRFGYSEMELSELVVPKRTLARRRAENELLTVEETDKALRLTRIATLAEKVFGDPTKAHRWLRKPKRSLSGDTPLAYLASENGARVVEEMLCRIEHGIYA